MSTVEAAAPKFVWTEENKAKLIDLHSRGYSSSRMARELDPTGWLTRNAVIGKRHRLGLPGGPASIRSQRFRKPPAQWRTEQIEQFRTLHGQGWSGEAVAKMVGMSPSAVYAKAFRLGLSFKASAAKRRQQSHPHPPLRRTPIFDLPVEHKPDAVLIIDLKGYHCRWPVGGAGKDTLYCGIAQEAGSSYCATHHDRSVS
jgi:GcrA cell cycle regulator